jgi:hypothetical protein
MKRILVVYWWPPSQTMRLAVEHHLRAFDTTTAEVVYVNAAARSPAWIRRVRYDAIVLHTTFLCVRWYVDFADYRERFAWIGDRSCTKVALPQDEYDHADVLDEWLDELGVTVIGSNFDAAARAPLYPKKAETATFLEVLTGYIDQAAAAYCGQRARPLGERSTAIVYRAQKLPYWFGSNGQLKHRIADEVARRAPRHGLTLDISVRPEDTIFGSGWLDFLMSGRAVIGSESGSSALDRRGEMQARIRELLSRNPSLTFEQVDAQMPPGWDSYAFFAISPRHLEAVVTRTAQLLVRGRYSGVLVPERHYIPIRRDFADLDEALARVNNLDALQEMADLAYEEIHNSGRWSIERFAETVLATVPRRKSRPVGDTVSSLIVASAPIANAMEHALSRVRGRSGGSLPVRRLALRTVVREPALVRFPVRALRHLDRNDARLVGRDLVRIALLLEFVRRQQGTDGPWHVQAVRIDDSLFLRSARGDQGPPPATSGIRQIVWDHSAVDGSRYEFCAFAHLAGRGVELAWPSVLVKALQT